MAASCTKSEIENTPTIVGKWQWQFVYDIYYRIDFIIMEDDYIEFHDDGTGVIYRYGLSQPFSYIVQSNNLIISAEGESSEFKISYLDNDELVLLMENQYWEDEYHNGTQRSYLYFQKERPIVPYDQLIIGEWQKECSESSTPDSLTWNINKDGWITYVGNGGTDTRPYILNGNTFSFIYKGEMMEYTIAFITTNNMIVSYRDEDNPEEDLYIKFKRL